MVYHVLNRANARVRIFRHPADYRAFLEALSEAKERVPMRLLAYCVMPNHWHLVLWPYQDGDLSRFVGWLTQTHAQRWHAFRKTVGAGHLYQGRFKSFPVQTDEHLLTAYRYVEANPLRSKLVTRAENWRWGSLWLRTRDSAQARRLLDAGPTPLPSLSRWSEWVNEQPHPDDVVYMRACVARGRPFGDDEWTRETAARLGLGSTLRKRGRPRIAL